MHLLPMTNTHQPEHIKACPGCGTSLIVTARHCAVCGYQFTDAAVDLPVDGLYARKPRPKMLVTLNLPLLLGFIVLLLAVNTLIILSFQKREETKVLNAAADATSTYVATIYVSPTPAPTETNTPGPPTETPVVLIEHTVVSGESCISIAQKYNIYVDDLLLKNKDLDCGLLNIGTVLRIPPAEPTAAPTENTPVP